MFKAGYEFCKETPGNIWDCGSTIWGTGEMLVTSGFGLFDTFGTKTGQDLMDELKNIGAMLDAIESQIDELFMAVGEAALQTQYSSAQRVISEAVRCYNNYLEMNSTEESETKLEDMHYWFKEFRKYGSLVRESTCFVMDGMLGKGLIASDILAIIRDKIAKVITSNCFLKLKVNGSSCILKIYIYFRATRRNSKRKQTVISELLMRVF